MLSLIPCSLNFSPFFARRRQTLKARFYLAFLPLEILKILILAQLERGFALTSAALGVIAFLLTILPSALSPPHVHFRACGGQMQFCAHCLNLFFTIRSSSE